MNILMADEFKSRRAFLETALLTSATAALSGCATAVEMTGTSSADSSKLGTTTLPWVDASANGSINATVATLGSTAAATLVVSSSQTLTASLVIPPNILLIILNGGMISVPNGMTITIKGAFQAGLYQAFTGSGTVTGLKEAIPDWFGGSGDGIHDSTAAILAAYNAVKDSGRTLIIPSGKYLFTTLDLDNSVGNPTRFVIKGSGTLKSIYNGFAFDSTVGHFYDLVIEGLRFESVYGSGTKLFNADKYMRLIISPGVQIRDFDYVLFGVGYMQSVKITNVIIRGGKQSVVKVPMTYDFQFVGNIVEWVNDGICIDGPGDPAVHTSSITGNVIEGISGVAIKLGACLATTVSNNYMEGNVGGDILLNASTVPHKGLIVQGNSIQLEGARLASGAFAIVWGSSTALPVKAGGNFCSGNLHDTTGVTATVDMSGDFAFGQLYKGYALYTETTPGRTPIGRASYCNGMSQTWAFGGQYTALDPYAQEVIFGGSYDSLVGGSNEPIVISFGLASPQSTPGNYARQKWAKGSYVRNAAPSVGSPKGWICTVEGTPGTWVSEGNL